MSTTILCPTRGGQASYPNQDRAIAIAKERGADLLFLYVSNVRFLGLTASPVVVDIETELEEMGDFLLAMAQERAEKAGVHAEIMVRRGVFRQVLKEAIEEVPVSAVILGSSGPGAGITTPEYIRELSEELSQETGIEFIVVEHGEIVSVFKPSSAPPAK